MLKSLSIRLGHLCVRSSGHILATLGLSLHIGSQSFAFFAGLQPSVNAAKEKTASSRGHNASLLGFILSSEITVFQATDKCMEQGGEVEENNKKVEYGGEVVETNNKEVYENLFNPIS